MGKVTDAQFRLRGAPAALVALLAAARAQAALITRTKAAKLLYLADLRAVEELGRPMSGVEWRWWHYGPYSKLLAAVEDDLVAAGIVERVTAENYYGNPEYRLRLSAQAPAADMDVQFAAIIEGVVTEYGNLAASTLRDVTYQTPPMIEAQREGARGEVLDLLSGRPVPDMSAAVRRLQSVLDRLPPQEDEGDLAGGMAEELAEWAPYQAAVNRAVLGDDDC